jgi:hypothetical protein
VAQRPISESRGSEPAEAAAKIRRFRKTNAMSNDAALISSQLFTNLQSLGHDDIEVSASSTYHETPTAEHQELSLYPV